MSDFATLHLDGQVIELPIIEGVEGNRGIDIRQLRQKTGYITYDPGYGNTGSCQSSIAYMDGEKGILRYRGIPIEDLAQHSSFVETSYLVINGELPTRDQLNRTSVKLNDHSLVHEDMQIFYQNFPRASHPMGILSAMINAMQSFYPELINTDKDFEEVYVRLISKIRTMAAISYKISRGHKVEYPRPDYTYCANFLNMMFNTPVKPYMVRKELVRALNVFWILHADHEQNCSTAVVRSVGSARTNIYASISAGVSALWGDLHGGANQAVIQMLVDIHEKGIKVKDVIKRAKDKNDPFRLMGFGHRVYKTYDPRAKIMKKNCHDVLERLNYQDPLLDIALELEDIGINDSYFIDHYLYPNVDFYSGIMLRAMGIPTNMFTVMFAIGRLPGWIAQWRENMQDPEQRLARPRQVYTGYPERPYTMIDDRGNRE
jgi:citrate synthase